MKIPDGYTNEKADKYKAFFTATKGVSAWTAAKVLTRIVKGVDFRGVSKSDIAKSICDETYPCLIGLRLDVLKDEIQKEVSYRESVDALVNRINRIGPRHS